jgi:transcriptional regulator GlxA family with amidase domain
VVWSERGLYDTDTGKQAKVLRIDNINSGYKIVMTPIKYMWHYRLNQGLELLRSTGLSIGEIAERVGFKTSYHFARMIKQETCKTASEIRRESWQGHK